MGFITMREDRNKYQDSSSIVDGLDVRIGNFAQSHRPKDRSQCSSPNCLSTHKENSKVFLKIPIIQYSGEFEIADSP